MIHLIYQQSIVRDLEKGQVYLLMSVAGIAMMVSGFICYVALIEVGFEVLFILGLVLLLFAYYATNRMNKSLNAELQDILDHEAANGYIHYMDGEPAENPATVTYLTK